MRIIHCTLFLIRFISLVEYSIEVDDADKTDNDLFNAVNSFDDFHIFENDELFNVEPYALGNKATCQLTKKATDRKCDLIGKWQKSQRTDQ
jgi:hypothetical protein